ncbi:Hypothetical protein CINCED_3A004172 [Cinara cedri]|uniref:Uncharacterized protein n=1 Tax=Cinara cedri TaxID=506608 RepID=A0A5E4NIE4_9HEMI|nr:Hypothetical protein CINCED_3A004172 [Cinara cedri]
MDGFGGSGVLLRLTSTMRVWLVPIHLAYPKSTVKNPVEQDGQNKSVEDCVGNEKFVARLVSVIIYEKYCRSRASPAVTTGFSSLPPCRDPHK